MTFRNKLPTLGMAVFAIAAVLMLPAQGFAGQGRGHKQHKKIKQHDKKIKQQNKKDEKFNNGHDARDGRIDGRGPTRDRDDDDDRYDRDRDRDNRDNRAEARERAQRVGYDEGYRAGQADRANGESADFRDEGVYQEATAGYRSEFGTLNYYRQQFRAAFAEGYRDGYRNRDANTRRGGIGGVIGDIIGRP